MVIEMIRKTIPRSPRAAVALVISLAALWRGTNGLVPLMGIGEKATGLGTLVTVLCLVVSLVAGVVFYYYQARDGVSATSSYNELEVLNHAQEIAAKQAKEEQLRHAATPVFSSQAGAVKPPSPAGPAAAAPAGTSASSDFKPPEAQKHTPNL
jgi:hypothetical protein